MAARVSYVLDSSRRQSAAVCRVRGYTLLELLAALVMGLMIVGVCISLFFSTQRMHADQQLADLEASPQAAEEWVRRDLMNSFLTEPELECTWKLEQQNAAGNTFSAFSFCTFERPPGERDPQWAVLHRVIYRVQAHSTKAPQLERLSIPVAGPGSRDGYRTNVLLAKVRTFRVQLYDGAWQTGWGEKNEVSPSLARIQLSIESSENGGPVSRDFMQPLPVGMSVTSRVLRSGTP